MYTFSITIVKQDCSVSVSSLSNEHLTSALVKSEIVLPWRNALSNRKIIGLIEVRDTSKLFIEKKKKDIQNETIYSIINVAPRAAIQNAKWRCLLSIKLLIVICASLCQPRLLQHTDHYNMCQCCRCNSRSMKSHTCSVGERLDEAACQESM